MPIEANTMTHLDSNTRILYEYVGEKKRKIENKRERERKKNWKQSQTTQFWLIWTHLDRRTAKKEEWEWNRVEIKEIRLKLCLSKRRLPKRIEFIFVILSHGVPFAGSHPLRTSYERAIAKRSVCIQCKGNLKTFFLIRNEIERQTILESMGSPDFCLFVFDNRSSTRHICSTRRNDLLPFGTIVESGQK